MTSQHYFLFLYVNSFAILSQHKKGFICYLQVAKGSRALMFECESNGEYLVIQRIALEQSKDEEDDDDDTVGSTDDYLGPEFEDLDDTLQQVRIKERNCIELAIC